MGQSVKSKANWGAVSALATVAAAAIAFAVWVFPTTETADAPVVVNRIELANSSDAAESPQRLPGLSPRSNGQTRANEPEQGTLPASRSVGANAPVDSTVEQPRLEQKQSIYSTQAAPQRVINIGPVSTTNQQDGVNAGYIENNYPPPDAWV